MKIRHKKTIGVFTVVVAAFAMLLFWLTTANLSTQNANATGTNVITNDEIKKRSLYQALNYCYSNFLEDKITVKGDVDYSGVYSYSIFKYDNSLLNQDADEVVMPTGFFGEETYACHSGVFMPSFVPELVGDVDLSTVKGRDDYFEGMGFEGSNSHSSTSTGETCVQYKYTYNDIGGTSNPAVSNKVCFKTDSEGKITSMDDKGGADRKNGKYIIEFVFGGTNDYDVGGDICNYGSNDECLNVYYNLDVNDSDSNKYAKRIQSIKFGKTTLDDVLNQLNKSGSTFWDTAGITQILNEHFKDSVGGSSSFNATLEKTTSTSEDATKVDNNTYTKTTNTNITTAVTYLENFNHETAAPMDDAVLVHNLTKAFDNTELYFIYNAYLTNTYAVSVAQEYCFGAKEELGDHLSAGSYMPVVVENAEKVKEWKYCIIDNYNTAGTGKGKVKTGASLVTAKTDTGFEGVVELINSLADIDIERLPAKFTEDVEGDLLPGDEETVDDGSPEDTYGDGSTLAACYESAGVLGWIMCPVIDMTSKVASEIYGKIEDDFLEIETSLMSGTTRLQLLTDAGYTSDEAEIIVDAGPAEIVAKLKAKGYSKEEAENMLASTGTHEGWQFFRDFANYIFAILFIVVILSQVTGFGISNYGIKKTLPRLIVVAVLVNISFIACQLAVDLSNILGNSLNSLFVNVAESIVDQSNVFHYGDVVERIGTNLLSGTAIVGTTFGLAVVAINTWEFWLLPLILVLISGVVGIMFFFLILGVRKAGVILLAIVAPIAIVCYALPNTKKIFDKWLKLFSSLLLVYPVCGALMGGGKLASTLLLNAAGTGDTGFIFTLIAMLLTVVPFFFIPSILKNSMAAMGNLGAKISSFGSRLGSGATGALRKSERLQEWNKRNQTNTQYRRAQRLENRIKKRGGTMSAGQARRVARAKGAFLKQQLDDNAASNTAANMTPDSIQNAIDAQDIKFRQQQYDEAESAILNGSATYTDEHGVVHKVNANDTSSLEAGHAAAVKHFLDTGDAQAGIQARAYQQLLLSKGGGAGRDSIYTNMMKAVQAERAAQSAGTYTGAQATERAQRLKDLGSHVASNERWKGAYKVSSPGAFDFFNDLAGSAEGISGVKSETTYQTSRLGKVTQNALPDMDDAWFSGVAAAATNTSAPMDYQQLQDLDSVMSQAVADPIIGTKIKNDANFAAMQKVHEAAYEARVQSAIEAGTVSSRSEFEGLYGAYQPLTLNKSSTNTITIPHIPTPPPAPSTPSGGTATTDSGIFLGNVSHEEFERLKRDAGFGPKK